MKISLPFDFRISDLRVEVHPSKKAASEAAAAKAAAILAEKGARKVHGHPRIVIGTGNSLKDLVSALARTSSVEWSAVEVFHMDEYVGIPATHPASFRRWLKNYLTDVVKTGEVHFLNGDAPDIQEECRRYGDLLRSAPLDLIFLGFGENGHIAFNDPPNADFNDPLVVKRVTLDAKCRMQQVGEGHFPDLQSVPPEALTVTCPALMSAQTLICCVPERRKAEAVRDALEGPISAACPASLIRRHPRAFVYLDEDSASLLKLPKQ